jgi:putative two-component system response regulator
VGHETAGFSVGAVDYIYKLISPPVCGFLVGAKRLKRSYRDVIFMLGTAGHYTDTDTDTDVHIWRMAAYAAALAQACGMSAEDCRLIELAAPIVNQHRKMTRDQRPNLTRVNRLISSFV